MPAAVAVRPHGDPIANMSRPDLTYLRSNACGLRIHRTYPTLSSPPKAGGWAHREVGPALKRQYLAGDPAVTKAFAGEGALDSSPTRAHVVHLVGFF